MTRPIVLSQPRSLVERRQPLLQNSSHYSSRGGGMKMAEVAGGTTAECAAVCCCCPCGLVNLLVLAVYKLPAGLCRKALRRNRRRKHLKKGMMVKSQNCSCDELEVQIHPVTAPISMLNGLESGPENKEIMELEKEMIEKFYAGGFWRSASRNSEC